MDAAQAAGAHEADSDRAAGSERPADRRRADRSLDDRGGEIARPDLARVGGEAAELVLREADAELPVEDSDRRRHGAGIAHAPLALEPDLDALAGREAVRDEGRLECDDGPPVGERVPDLVGNPDRILHGIEPSRAMHRAAAAIAVSGPPTR